MNFITNNNNNYEIDNQNGSERIKKKKISKKKIKIMNNIYDLPKEEPKTSNIKNRQKINRFNKNSKNINNQMSQFRNNKMITNSNTRLLPDCKYARTREHLQLSFNLFSK